MLEFKEENGREKWNEFIINNKGSFLQSFEWGQFQRALGKKVWRFGIFRDNLVIAEIQMIKETFPLKRKSFFYIPFGPTFEKNIGTEKKKEIFDLFFEKITQIAKKEKTIFLRIEPLSSLFEEENFETPPRRIQPQKTLLLDLKKKEEDIFKNFTYKVRYNIRLSERKGVKIEFKDEYLPEFYELIKKTAKKDRFCPFDEEYYKKLFDIVSKDFKVKLCLANYKGKIIAANILIFFGKDSISVHGASDCKYKVLKAPNFLQWERIRFSKNSGYERYNFWGIDEKKWPGLTFFKKGFGGEEFIYPEGRDIVFQNFWYRAYKLLRKIKKCF
jgi:lipid II:glycine glycyltransferase (peptidoglycan interpeptide bridge formation enzyme)